jgi:hypothetical protein
VPPSEACIRSYAVLDKLGHFTAIRSAAAVTSARSNLRYRHTNNVAAIRPHRGYGTRRSTSQPLLSPTAKPDGFGVDLSTYRYRVALAMEENKAASSLTTAQPSPLSSQARAIGSSGTVVQVVLRQCPRRPNQLSKEYWHILGRTTSTAGVRSEGPRCLAQALGTTLRPRKLPAEERRRRASGGMCRSQPFVVSHATSSPGFRLMQWHRTYDVFSGRIIWRSKIPECLACNDACHRTPSTSNQTTERARLHTVCDTVRVGVYGHSVFSMSPPPLSCRWDFAEGLQSCSVS